MVPAPSGFRRVLGAALFLALSLTTSQKLVAQEARALSDYVIEQYGQPPETPSGRLSAEIQAAARVAFVDSIANGLWGAEQDVALAEIAEAKDPRLAWLISDLLRFAGSRQLTETLAVGATESVSYTHLTLPTKA